jgi:O-antigen ligase
MAFWFGVGVVFVRFSMIHEAAMYLLGVNLYLLYIFAIPALAGVVLTGGLPRTFSAPAVYLWFGFALWMAAAVPFSWWQGNSFEFVLGYFKTEVPTIFIIAGLVMTWQECRIMLATIALAAVVNVGLCRLLAGEMQGRMALEISDGMITNPNDLAGHLILVLPFILAFAFAPKRPILVKIAASFLVAYGYLITLSTASRGAFVAVIIFAVFVLVRASMAQRIAVAVAVPLLAVIAASTLPPETVDRLTSFSTESSGPHRDEAADSAQSRTYLFKRSIQFSLEKPLFGVGPGNFMTYEGARSKEEGQRGAWHDAHNSYTQVSAENGIPALFLFLACIVSGYRMLMRTNKLARSHGEHGEDIARATFWVMAACVGFYSAITFLNFYRRFYVPALIALAVVIARAAAKELASRAAAGSMQPIQPHPVGVAVPAQVGRKLRRPAVRPV